MTYLHMYKFFQFTYIDLLNAVIKDIKLNLLIDIDGIHEVDRQL